MNSIKLTPDQIQSFQRERFPLLKAIILTGITPENSANIRTEYLEELAKSIHIYLEIERSEEAYLREFLPTPMKVHIAGIHAEFLTRGQDVTRLDAILSALEIECSFPLNALALSLRFGQKATALLNLASFTNASQRIAVLSFDENAAAKTLNASSSFDSHGDLLSPFSLAQNQILFLARSRGTMCLASLPQGGLSESQLKHRYTEALKCGFDGVFLNSLEQLSPLAKC
ncbi:hypothetical protein [Flexibacterium corallicola]|uniref:hypothetical protein n=1 Tax=Flexibacterium corallicola TaxID=3037259 RepID=UPI00286F7F6C|nr:hypothetical protein [Pseudovibrio sp. M1P-2-3]